MNADSSDASACAKCGIPLKQSAKFCPGCGRQVETKLKVIPTTTPAPMSTSESIDLTSSASSSTTAAGPSRENDTPTPTPDENHISPVEPASAPVPPNHAPSIDRTAGRPPSSVFLWSAAFIGVALIGLTAIGLLIYHNSRSASDIATIAPTPEGLRAYLQSIEGKMIPIYTGKGRYGYFLFQGGKLYSCMEFPNYKPSTLQCINATEAGLVLQPYTMESGNGSGLACASSYGQFTVGDNSSIRNTLCVSEKNQDLDDYTGARHSLNVGVPFFNILSSPQDSSGKIQLVYFSLSPETPTTQTGVSQETPATAPETTSATEPSVTAGSDATEGCESHRGNQIQSLMIVNDLKSQDGTQQIAGNVMRQQLNKQGVSDECIQYLAQTYSLAGTELANGSSNAQASDAEVDGASVPAQENAVDAAATSAAAAEDPSEGMEQSEQSQASSAPPQQTESASVVDADGKMRKWIAACAENSRVLTTKAGSQIGLSQQEAMQYCGCVYRSSDSPEESPVGQDQCLDNLMN